MPTASGYMSPEEIARLRLLFGETANDYQGYDPSMLGAAMGDGNSSNYSSYTPITLPQQFWPDQDTYNRTAEQMRSFGITPPPIGTLDPQATSALGTALYNQPSRLDDPLTPALIMMGGAALGGAFANGGAGYGAAATPAATPAYTGATTAAGLPTGSAAAAGGGVGTLAGSVPAVGASPGLAGTAGAIAGGAGSAAGNAAGGAVSGLNWADIVPSIVSGLTGIAGANAQADSSKEALALAERMYNQSREDALPMIRTGNAAIGVLDDYLGLTTGAPNRSRFVDSPSYQYDLEQTTKAGERALSAMGLNRSGAQVREAQRNAVGLSSRNEGAFVDRLLASAGLGTTGAAQSNTAGSNFASMGGQALQNKGAARSSGYGAINDATQGGFANYFLRQYLNRGP